MSFRAKRSAVEESFLTQVGLSEIPPFRYATVGMTGCTMNISSILKKYDVNNLTIAVIGSHSALDVCRGAKDMGFKTLVIAEKGREKTYAEYYKFRDEIGCVDECLVLPKFADILKPEIQNKLLKQNVLFIPNRSFEVYLHFDYKAIERTFKVPMFGNRFMLNIEERNKEYNQYSLLKDANILYPKHFKKPDEIDRLCLIKVAEKERTFERAFFLVKNFDEYKKKSWELIEQGKITKEALDQAVIEEFVVGAQVNFNFFYSPLSKRVELLGTDTRRQTNLDGLLRLSATHQTDVLKYLSISYEEAGHVAVTVLESLLEPAFAMGERFVKAAEKKFAPGITGPFSLQSIITPGPPKKEIVVIDVSPRMPGSPGITATPYSNYLWGKSVSVGKRIAMEVQAARYNRSLEKILT